MNKGRKIGRKNRARKRYRGNKRRKRDRKKKGRKMGLSAASLFHLDQSQ